MGFTIFALGVVELSAQQSLPTSGFWAKCVHAVRLIGDCLGGDFLRGGPRDISLKFESRLKAYKFSDDASIRNLARRFQKIYSLLNSSDKRRLFIDRFIDGFEESFEENLPLFAAILATEGSDFYRRAWETKFSKYDYSPDNLVVEFQDERIIIRYNSLVADSIFTQEWPPYSFRLADNGVISPVSRKNGGHIFRLTTTGHSPFLSRVEFDQGVLPNDRQLKSLKWLAESYFDLRYQSRPAPGKRGRRYRIRPLEMPSSEIMRNQTKSKDEERDDARRSFQIWKDSIVKIFQELVEQLSEDKERARMNLLPLNNELISPAELKDKILELLKSDQFSHKSVIPNLIRLISPQREFLNDDFFFDSNRRIFNSVQAEQAEIFIKNSAPTISDEVQYWKFFVTVDADGVILSVNTSSEIQLPLRGTESYMVWIGKNLKYGKWDYDFERTSSTAVPLGKAPIRAVKGLVDDIFLFVRDLHSDDSAERIEKED